MYTEDVMVIRDMIRPLDATSQLNKSSASFFSKRKELIRVTEGADKRYENGNKSNAADTKAKHEETHDFQRRGAGDFHHVKFNSGEF